MTVLFIGIPIQSFSNDGVSGQAAIATPGCGPRPPMPVQAVFMHCLVATQGWQFNNNFHPLIPGPFALRGARMKQAEGVGSPSGSSRSELLIEVFPSPIPAWMGGIGEKSPSLRRTRFPRRTHACHRRRNRVAGRAETSCGSNRRRCGGGRKSEELRKTALVTTDLVLLLNCQSQCH